VELRFFFCGVISGEPQPGHFAELRWVARAQLSEYDFDGVSHPVVKWLLDQP
jgi:hypothetical protein